MLKMPDTKPRYFSVTHSTKIQGAHYVPSVCYPLTNSLQATVEEMVKKDLAKTYPEKVRFVTGVPYPVKQPEAVPSSAPVPNVKTGKTLGTEYASPGKPVKGNRKGRDFE
jgi:hypothetical protein